MFLNLAFQQKPHSIPVLPEPCVLIESWKLSDSTASHLLPLGSNLCMNSHGYSVLHGNRHVCVKDHTYTHAHLLLLWPRTVLSNHPGSRGRLLQLPTGLKEREHRSFCWRLGVLNPMFVFWYQYFFLFFFYECLVLFRLCFLKVP